HLFDLGVHGVQSLAVPQREPKLAVTVAIGFFHLSVGYQDALLIRETVLSNQGGRQNQRQNEQCARMRPLPRHGPPHQSSLRPICRTRPGVCSAVICPANGTALPLTSKSLLLAKGPAKLALLLVLKDSTRTCRRAKSLISLIGKFLNNARS